MFSAERVFIEDMEELQRTIDQPTPYRLRTLPGIFRRLLMDNRSVAEVVAKGRDFAPRFRVGGKPDSDIRKQMPPGFTAHLLLQVQTPLSRGNTDPNAHYVEMSKTDFLRFQIAWVDGNEFTVKEMIQFVGFKSGGIHWDPTRKGTEEALDKLARTLVINNDPYPLTQMLGIAGCVLEAYWPLYMRLKS
ncbi:MAG TPA: hypothetical protein VMD53_17250 [Rhizomicrobium sp.]|nr:hypothetical protein [Rhizomicrobium sp.]